VIAGLLRDKRAWGGVAALVAAVLILVLVVLPGGGSAAPATGAVRLVPADALVYVHVSTDPDREETTHALDLVGRFPSVGSLERRAVTSLRRFNRGTGVDFERDIRPWLGREAALALLNTTTAQTGSVFILDVRDQSKAREFLARLGEPSATSTYHGATIQRFGGQAFAFVSHYLAAGTLDGVEAAVDAHAQPATSLASSGDYAAATTGEPAGRVADAYVSAAGVDRLLAPQTGALGVVGTLLRRPGLRSAGLSLTAHGDTASLRIQQALEPGSAPGVAGLPLPSFAPELPGDMPGPDVAFADAGGLSEVLPRLLRAASLGRTLAGVARRLDGVGIDLRRDIVNPLFSDEVAAALLPSASAVPTLLVLSRVDDEARAREALAQLQPGLTRLLGPAVGTSALTPTFTQHQVGGVTAFQLRVSPTFELDYAVADHRVAISTSLDGIAAWREGHAPVDKQAAFAATLGDRPSEVTSLTFLDLSQLLDLAEESGLRDDPQYVQVRDDLRRVRALGLQTASGETESTAEISLQIR
jgi:Protein of unknown function (DUF3352)